MTDEGVKKIKKLMIDKGVKSQKSLATLTGLSRPTIQKVLTGGENISLGTIRRLVQALSISETEAGEIFF